jgi:thiosulfate/3-mercaptopyruvate sulfurtransferase
MSHKHPEVLVSTDWVKEHLADPSVKLLEVDVDTQAYEAGHIPGSVGLNWQTELQDQTTRDILSKEQFEELMSACGVMPEDTVVLYGDNYNWFAAYAFWMFTYYGHQDVRLMDGGRQKWLDEDDKELTTEPTRIAPTTYRASEPNPSLRAYFPDAREASQKPDAFNLVDVRSADEFTGRVIAPQGMNETAQRGGHIPGARNVPWKKAVQDDGTFKPYEELKDLYLNQQEIDPSKPTIAYCRIGERSSHTWFVLRYLLGLDDVKNYDGSWTEYGNIVGAPIEKGEPAETSDR